MPDETQADGRVVAARIHPAIGVARVGNAASAFFLGPEVTEPPVEAPGFYRDDTGALKRQAARFRIYGYDAAGQAVAELTAQNAEIAWTVQVANLKAAWYQFQIALDVPEAADAKASAQRNAAVAGADRDALMIRPSAKTIAGRGVCGPGYAFDDGRFQTRAVYLGEVMTDEAGRLLVLGGRGVAASPDGVPINDFANNDGWYDDISDGPVTATVTIDGRSIPVDPAWVVVAPPNYAPRLKAVRTMYDLLTEAFIDAGALSLPAQVSFQRDVLPIFQRLAALQWVNQGFARAFGRGGWLDFSSPEALKRLSSPAAGMTAEFRRQIANLFRNFDKDSWSPAPLPWVYGDSMDVPAAHTPRQHTQLAKQQYHALQLWAAGKFDADYDPSARGVSALDELGVAAQPAMLDRAALEFCLADAFHPGCEMTWPVRHPSMYMAPFRLKHRAADDPGPTYGDILTPEQALAFDGLLYGQHAGWLSRWMAVPWHADTASCRSGYEQGAYDFYLPTFWPARVPNQVLTVADYAVIAGSDDPAARQAAFDDRSDWDDNPGRGRLSHPGPPYARALRRDGRGRTPRGPARRSAHPAAGYGRRPAAAEAAQGRRRGAPGAHRRGRALAESLRPLSARADAALTGPRRGVFDVAIVGAGPAGAATAIALAGRASVALIERTPAPVFRIGENLPGAARPALRELGLLDAVAAGRHAPSLGVLSAWGSGEVVARDAFLDPQGPGWRLDRAAFEAGLRAAALAAGATPAFGAAVSSVRRDATWNLELAGRAPLRARFLVDATGRAARLARRLGARVETGDALVCRFVRLPPAEARGRFEGFHLVEAVREGWWYATGLPDGGGVIAFHTDPDLAAAGDPSGADGLRTRLAQTRHAAVFAARWPWPARLRAARQSARSQRLAPVAGDGWAAVGDAAIAFDPLSSFGLTSALQGALALGRAVAGWLSGDGAALGGYAAALATLARRYAEDKAACYGQERRFSADAFWARRRAP
jgi:flavin-dependent dehydrogenase